MKRTNPLVSLVPALLAGGCCLSHGPGALVPDGIDQLDAAEDAAADDTPADDAASDDVVGEEVWDATFPDVGACHVTPAVRPFLDPVAEIIWDGTDAAAFTGRAQVCMTPLVIDLDPEIGDGQPEIVFTSYSILSWRNGESGGVIRVVDGRSGATLYSIPNDDAIEPYVEATAHLAAGDLDGDGIPEVVGLTPMAGSIALHRDGTVYWRSVHPTQNDNGLELRRRALSGAPAIADLDGDGRPEVIVGRTAIDGQTGRRLWVGAGGVGLSQMLGPISCVADLDGDGQSEVVAGNTAYESNGATRWQTPWQDGFCGIGDFFDEPGPEVVLVTAGMLHILRGTDGADLWAHEIPGNIGPVGAGGPPTIADFDGDGRPEIGVANGGRYTVFDTGCAGPSPEPDCFGDGVRWSNPTDDSSSSVTGSAVFDFDGDGAAEVVYNDQRYFRLYDGRTGAERFNEDNSSRTRTEYPVVADVDNDGSAEIVFAANNEASFLTTYFNAGIEVWGSSHDFWVGARRVWNEHIYHVTNVTEDGRIPAVEEPSWATLNSYRQNLAENRDALASPDLRGLADGPATCVAGQARLNVRVENGGTRRAGAGVVIGVYRGDVAAGVRIAEAVTATTLEPGGSEIVALSFATAPGACQAYWALIDDAGGRPDAGDGGSVRECAETDNLVFLGCLGC